ncbi:hypothetical protein CTAYLR_003726 [Chrysophaeum taylorii]|uniref:C2 domain-containing protein n=1 Tax=Chrysophaeum taylorii TaxID=2483200 RepID=A0AAD7UNR8_9STRA|nr:hypothetical protein CTAYLR_003726 [Chrysophaeum taylorii]
MTGFHPRWSWHAVQDTFSHDFESDADAEDEPHATGELKLAVGWRFNEDLAQEYLVVVEADGSSADVEPNEIHVAVVSARGVGRNADLPSSREVLEEVPPRVQASIQTVCGPSQLDEIRWTTTAKPSYRPEWGETFVIDIPEADEITPELRLSVTCWDRRSERQDNGCLGAALVPLAPLLNKERYRRWFALAPSKQQPDTKESPGWRTLDDIEDQAAPFGVVDVVLRVVASPSRAAEHLTPIGLVSRACRRFQLSPEDATLSLRHATVGRRDVCLLAALLDPDVTNEAAGVIRAPELTKADLRTCGLDGENLAILVASLHRNTTLDAIDVSGNAYSDGFRSPAAYVLSPDQHDKHRLEPIAPNPGMSALGAALVANTTLRRLNLRDARLESSGLAAVALGLRKNCSLTELKLGRNMICNVTVQGMGRFDPSGIGALATALGVHPALRHLDLSRNQICGIAASIFWRACA